MAADERHWREIPFSPDVLYAWDITQEPDEPVNERRARLRAELITALRDLVSSHLTDRLLAGAYGSSLRTDRSALRSSRTTLAPYRRFHRRSMATTMSS